MKKMLTLAAVALAAVALAGCCCPDAKDGCKAKQTCVCKCCEGGKCCCKECKCRKAGKCCTAKSGCPEKQECPKQECPKK